MATPLFLMLDDALEPAADATGRHATGLLTAVVASAPRGTDVVGFVSSSNPARDDDDIIRRFPGLDAVRTSRLSHRQLAAAWQHGFTPRLGGMIHSPSLFAPLGHGRDQTVITVQDAAPWQEPELVAGTARWFRNMAKRADRYADAVVVPSHAVADQLNELGLFGSRIHVIPGAATRGFVVPDDAEQRRRTLGVPERYLVSTARSGRGLSELLSVARRLQTPVVLLDDAAHGEAGMDAGFDSEATDGRDFVQVLADLDSNDRAALLAGAAVFVEPGRLEGFGIDVLDAMTAGAPIVATDDPALVELALDAARVVPRGEAFESDLYDAVSELLDDDASARRFAIAGQDRARAFTWAGAAEKVWELHADL